MQNRQKFKYVDLWKKQMPAIKRCLQACRESSGEALRVTLHQEEFHRLGNRKGSGYSFNLEYRDGQVINNISGTAVARDLKYAIASDMDVMQLIQQGHFKLNMGKDFILKIQCLL